MVLYVLYYCIASPCVLQSTHMFHAVTSVLLACISETMWLFPHFAMCELSVLHCGWDDKTLYWYVKFWWKLLFCIFFFVVCYVDFVLTKFCMSICKDVLLMEPCNLHDLTVHAPGGHLYFRVDIILVKGRSKLALSTYFPNMKIDPNYTFCMFFFPYFFSIMFFPKFVKMTKTHPFFIFFFMRMISNSSVSPPPVHACNLRG